MSRPFSLQTCATSLWRDGVCPIVIAEVATVVVAAAKRSPKRKTRGTEVAKKLREVQPTLSTLSPLANTSSFGDDRLEREEKGDAAVKYSEFSRDQKKIQLGGATKFPTVTEILSNSFRFLMPNVNFKIQNSVFNWNGEFAYADVEN